MCGAINQANTNLGVRDVLSQKATAVLQAA